MRLKVFTKMTSPTASLNLVPEVEGSSIHVITSENQLLANRAPIIFLKLIRSYYVKIMLIFAVSTN
jgi:hypothetical protein